MFRCLDYMCKYCLPGMCFLSSKVVHTRYVTICNSSLKNHHTWISWSCDVSATHRYHMVDDPRSPIEIVTF